MYNARYVPPNGNRRPQPLPRPPAQKRVQIIDHNRQTPSSDNISERESQNSYSPDTIKRQQRAAQTRREHPSAENKSESNQSSPQRTNSHSVHDYLYGLSAPDPGQSLIIVCIE